MPGGRIFLVKSSGDVEQFDPTKLAISFLKAGVPYREVGELVGRIKRELRDGMSTNELRAVVFSNLKKAYPEAARNFKKKGEFYIRTTEERIERWELGKITESLTAETGLDQEIAKQIAREVEKDIQRMDLDFVSGPLLREMVNVKLLERGMEDVRAKYTRLGLPVSDVKDLVHRKPPLDLLRDASQAVIEQYMLLDVLPRHLTDPHFRGAYNIPELMSFVLHPLGIQHELGYFFEKGNDILSEIHK